MDEVELIEQIHKLDSKLRQIEKAYTVFSSVDDIPESLKKDKFDTEKSILQLRQALGAISQNTSASTPLHDAGNAIFVIMPFKDPFNGYYSDIIKPSMIELNYAVIRSDEIYSPTSFIQTIWNQIVQSRLVIAEMTSMNANVLYELGLCHAINKTVIMIAQSIEHIPADLRHINCIIYNTLNANWSSYLSSNIQKMVLHVDQNSERQSYLHPVASVDNTIFVESVLRQRDAAQNENTKLAREVVSYKRSVAALVSRKHELESVQRTLKRNNTHTIVCYDDADTQTTIYAFPIRDTGMNIDLVKIDAGKFVHGVGDNKEYMDLDEYYISRFSITNAMYACFLNNVGNRIENDVKWLNVDGVSPCDKCRIYFDGKEFKVEDGYEDFPVTYVNYYGANAFCQWADGELPTEEQWEKAVRGTDGRHYPWGNEPPTDELANYLENGWGRDVAPIAVFNKKAGISPFGVVQGIGNVWHWTQTYYADRGVQAVRGGSFFDFRLGNRNVYRFVVQPDGPDFSQGFLFCKRFLYTSTQEEVKDVDRNSSEE